MAQGLDTDSAYLPPPGVYISPQDYHEYSAMGMFGMGALGSLAFVRPRRLAA